MSKNGQSFTGSTVYFSDEFLNLNRNTNMETNIAVKEMPAMDLIHSKVFIMLGCETL